MPPEGRFTTPMPQRAVFADDFNDRIITNPTCVREALIEVDLISASFIAAGRAASMQRVMAQEPEEMVGGGSATKDFVRAEVAELRTEVRTDIAEVRTEIAEVRTEIAELRAEMRTEIAEVRTDIAELRAEMRTEIAEVRTEMAELRMEVRTDIAAMEARLVREITGMQRWIIGIGITLVIAILVQGLS